MNSEVPSTYCRTGSMRRRKSNAVTLDPSLNLDMSPTDVMQKCRQYFRSVDKDGNGTINRREFKELIDNICGVELDARQLERSFKRTDQNNDGTITFKEFFEAFSVELTSSAKNGNAPLSENVQHHSSNTVTDSKLMAPDVMKKCRQYFSALDKDGDGTMDRIEFRKMIAKFGMELDAKELERAYHKADLNRDGVITFKEFFDAYSSDISSNSVGKKTSTGSKYRRRTSSNSSDINDTVNNSRGSSKSNSRSSSVDLDEIKYDSTQGANSEQCISDIRTYLQKVGVQTDDAKICKKNFQAVLKYVDQKNNSNELKKTFDIVDRSEIDAISFNEFLDVYIQQQYMSSRRRSSCRRRMSSEPPLISMHSIPEQQQSSSRTIPEHTESSLDTAAHYRDISDNFLSKCRGYFFEQDEDGNGKLSMIEFQSMLGRIGLQMPTEKIKQLYKKVDRNKDGSISYREFAEAYMKTLTINDKKELSSNGINQQWRRDSVNGVKAESRELLSIDRQRDRRYSSVEPDTLWTSQSINNENIEFDRLRPPYHASRRSSAALIEHSNQHHSLQPTRDLQNRRHSSIETISNVSSNSCLERTVLTAPERSFSTRRCSANCIEQPISEQFSRTKNNRRSSSCDSNIELKNVSQTNSNTDRKLEHLSEKELQAYFKCFWNSDKDFDGKLSLAEFSKLIENLGLKLNKRELEKAFTVADTNTDGCISFNEYLTAYFNKTILQVLPLEQIMTRLGGNVNSNIDQFFLGKNECFDLMRQLGNYLDDDNLDRFISGVDHKYENVVRLRKFYHYLGSNI